MKQEEVCHKMPQVSELGSSCLVFRGHDDPIPDRFISQTAVTASLLSLFESVLGGIKTPKRPQNRPPASVVNKAILKYHVMQNNGKTLWISDDFSSFCSFVAQHSGFFLQVVAVRFLVDILLVRKHHSLVR